MGRKRKSQLARFEDTPIARARELLLSLTPQDENLNLGLARIEETMTQGLYLHGLGIIPDRKTARYTLADRSGKEFRIEVHTISLAESMSMKWFYAFKLSVCAAGPELVAGQKEARPKTNREDSKQLASFKCIWPPSEGA